VDAVGSGARLAIALAGVERDALHVGATLVRAEDPWIPTRRARADVSLAADAPAVGVRARLRFHLGTAECGVRIVARGGPVLPGERRAVRLALDAPMVLRAGDRFVLRGGAPHTTIGGGAISDPAPTTPRVRPWPEAGADAATRLQWMLEESGAAGVDVASLPIRLGLRPAEVERLLKDTSGTATVAGRLLATGALDALRRMLIDEVQRAHAAAPLAPGLDRETARSLLRAAGPVVDEVIRRAERAGMVETAGSALRIPGWQPGAGVTSSDEGAKLLDTLRSAGVEPPSVTELTVSFGKDVVGRLKLLEKEGQVVQVVSDRWFAASAVAELLARLRASVEAGRRYSPSELREILKISRKYLIPFLEWTDRRRISHRADDGRTFHDIPAKP
jgi:selenocysteine-specific elongation factor